VAEHLIVNQLLEGLLLAIVLAWGGSLRTSAPLVSGSGATLTATLPHLLAATEPLAQAAEAGISPEFKVPSEASQIRAPAAPASSRRVPPTVRGREQPGGGSAPAGPDNVPLYFSSLPPPL
jgi:hypothetical protein